jgi:hypothetical protein
MRSIILNALPKASDHLPLGIIDESLVAKILQRG